jgi:hydroxylamine reductase (hybrid-cluster protein)
METELSKQKALRAKQEAITEEQQGLANVAKAKYEKEVEKVREVTEAQKKFEVEELAAKTAKETAKKIEAEGYANAAANRALVSAGLTPEQRMQMDIKIADVVSANISKASTPAVVFMGSDKGSADEVMKVFGAERSLELINKMKGK